uniref:ZnMc domain-containing protein n=1 Tax=Panagrellus redivivus TaxID=6233 RepID=A0A7E4ZV99_PANRE
MFHRTCFAVGVLIAVGLACLGQAMVMKPSRVMAMQRAENKNKLKVTVDEEFVKTYLRTFGYLNASLEDPTNEDMSEAVTAFQTFMGIPSTGVMNGATASLMARKRCGNKDVHPVLDTPLWKQDYLTWNITHFPTSISEEKLRELIQQAFSAWEVVINVSFIELPDASNADIVISFEHLENDWQNDATHLTIGRASGPIASRVWLSADEEYTTDPADDGILLFNVLVHELGHVLGLRHSADANSVMHPLFDRAMGKAHPEITNDDVERIRTFYDFTLTENLTDIAETSNTSYGCPTDIQVVSSMNIGRVNFFQDNLVWAFQNETFEPAKEIIEVFDAGPSYVNASTSIGNLTLLFSDREIHGYYYDKNGALTSAPGFPKVLHNRVIFYPEAAVPLKNGTILLLKDDVFATYDVFENVPTMMGDARVYFPNLPDNIVGAVPDSEYNMDLMFFFNKTKMIRYSMRSNQIEAVDDIGDFFICDL